MFRTNYTSIIRSRQCSEWWTCSSSETYTGCKNSENKDYLLEIVHLVVPSTHCNMMRGAYNVKLSRKNINIQSARMLSLYCSEVIGKNVSVWFKTSEMKWSWLQTLSFASKPICLIAIIIIYTVFKYYVRLDTTKLNHCSGLSSVSAEAWKL